MQTQGLNHSPHSPPQQRATPPTAAHLCLGLNLAGLGLKTTQTRAHTHTQPSKRDASTSLSYWVPFPYPTPPLPPGISTPQLHPGAVERLLHLIRSGIGSSLLHRLAMVVGQERESQ